MKSNQVQEDSQEVSPHYPSPFKLIRQRKMVGIAPFQPTGGRR